MSLFLKIFLWFWLAIALLVSVFSFVSWTTQNEPFVRQWQTHMSDMVSVQVETAAQIYENEGKKGLDLYLGRIKNLSRIGAVAFLDGSGYRISGDDLTLNTSGLIEKTRLSTEVEYQFLPDLTLAAKKTAVQNPSAFILVVQVRRPPPLVVFDATSWMLRILAVILTGGLVCYGLARYLSAPIVKLQQATRKLAGGELKARVGTKIGRGGDEFSQLARDFDEMAERIESLVMQEKRLTQDISHELRSPLARMNVALEIAKQKSNAETQPILERLEKESNRLNEMISRLLILSKLESGGQEIEKQNIDLKKLVEEIVADAEFEAGAKNKAVKITAIEDSRFAGSENLLRSAVENVLRNAVRYTGEKTAVEVSLRNRNGDAVINITDHGGGVPDDELENLFRPFYRIGEARERRSGGVGLGLAIAQRAVFAHKGSIKAENTRDGLTVEIKLPRNDAHQQTI